MVTIHIKRNSDFNCRPELDALRQTFKNLEALIANSPDTPKTTNCNFRGSYLNGTVAVLKANNLKAQKFEDTHKVDEGNLILETKIQVHPNILNIYINLLEIGITEGRGAFELKPEHGGFWLYAQELDYFKNSQNSEAHALKRTIARFYAVKGQYDWQNMHHNLMPDGTLYVAVNPQCHPGLTFPNVNEGPVYSSVSNNPGFPPTDAGQTFGKFGNSCPTPMVIQPTVSRCCQCGGVKSVGVQTGSSLCNIPSGLGSCPSAPNQNSLEQFHSSVQSSIESYRSSWFQCTCDLMEL